MTKITTIDITTDSGFEADLFAKYIKKPKEEPKITTTYKYIYNEKEGKLSFTIMIKVTASGDALKEKYKSLENFDEKDKLKDFILDKNDQLKLTIDKII